MPKSFKKISMPRKNTLFIMFLIAALLVPAYASSVSAAQGRIFINSTVQSAPNQQVQAGGDINLFFGQVSWSGTQVYLLVSHDTSEQVSVGDMIYTPTFSVSDLTNPATAKTVTSAAGTWVLGGNWINGTFAPNVPVGNYTIKVFDLGSASVAVTDIYVVIYSVIYSSNLQLIPPSGPGGVSIQFAGSGFPPSSPVTISYLDPAFGSWNFLASTAADASGKISLASQAPDLGRSVGSGDYPESSQTISYRAEIQGVIYCYVNYNQYSRGLKRVGNQTANGLYGNGTDLSRNVNVASGDSLAIAGKWFHPGDAIYIRWDGKSVVGTVTGNQWLNAQIIGTSIADQSGSFTTTATIPVSDAGIHYISVEDSQTKVLIRVSISTASLQISPASGPGGISVSFSGLRYPPLAPVTVSCLDPNFSNWIVVGSTVSDASGKISINASVPDLRKSVTGFDSSEIFNPISFRSESGGVVYCTVNYNEYARGLKRVGNQIAKGLYGNGTDMSSTVRAVPGDSISIVGKWFHPGDAIYVRWDGKTVVGTVTGNQWLNAQIIGTSIADSVGGFTATATIPSADSGSHYLSIEDSQTKVILKVAVTSSSDSHYPKLPSSIDLSCNSTTSYFGYEVNIFGKLTSNLTAVSGQPIQVSYSVTGGNSLQNLTFVYTASDGTFSAKWMPQVSGTYLIMATYGGNSANNGTSRIVTLASTPYSNQNVLSVVSNSTVSALSFDSKNNLLTFVVSGPSQTKGFTDVAIAKNLISDISKVRILVDNVSQTYTVTSSQDSWFLHFTYSHSTHTVQVEIGSALPATSSPSSSPTPVQSPATSQPSASSPSNSQTDTPTSAPTETLIPTITPSPKPITSPSPTQEIPELTAASVLITLTVILSAIVMARRKRKPEIWVAGLLSVPLFLSST